MGGVLETDATFRSAVYVFRCGQIDPGILAACLRGIALGRFLHNDVEASGAMAAVGIESVQTVASRVVVHSESSGVREFTPHLKKNPPAAADPFLHTRPSNPSDLETEAWFSQDRRRSARHAAFSWLAITSPRHVGTCTASAMASSPKYSRRSAARFSLS